MGVSDADVRTVWRKNFVFFKIYGVLGEEKGQLFFYKRLLTEEVWVLHPKYIKFVNYTSSLGAVHKRRPHSGKVVECGHFVDKWRGGSSDVNVRTIVLKTSDFKIYGE